MVGGAKISLPSTTRRAQVNFDEPLKVLCSAEVRFVIIGGVAMSLQGSAFVTNDLDVLYARDVENIRKLVAALKPYEPQLRVPGGEVPFRFDERTIKNGLNFTLVTRLGWIDLLAEVAGIGDFEAAKKMSKEIRLGDQVVHVLSLSGLIKAKKTAGRHKDLMSLPELEALEELERKTELPKFE
jgi:hypothetical protein